MLYSAKTNGFYLPDIHDNIPDDAVEISNDYYVTLLDGQAKGQTITADDNGMPVLVEPPAPVLDYIKQDLKSQIDVAAENERLRYITAGSGQAMTYQEKVAQSFAYTKTWLAHAADPDNVPEVKMAEYPLLAASLGIDGDTLLEVSETVTYAYALWQQIGAAIEATRLLAKIAIDNAVDEADAQSIFDAIVWPTPQSLEGTS